MLNSSIRKLFLPGFLLLVGFCLSSYVIAHNAYTGKSLATVNPQSGVTIEMHFAAVTIEGFMTDLSGRDNQVSSQNLKNIREHLSKKVRHFYEVTINGKPIELDSLEIEVKNQQDAVSIALHYPGPLLGTLGLSGEFIKQTNPEYQSTLTVLDDSGVQLGLFIQTFDAYYSEIVIDNSAANTANNEGVFSRFLHQGILHILLGYDHLLFLMALLIVCRSWRPAVFIITSFTLAHTLTLSLAALGFVGLPVILVEIVIALTIVYVGVENLWTRHQPKVRWALTAIFGLAHGFGFANVLRGIGLGTDGAPIALPLFAFNLGVEIGQLVLAAIFLPLLWQARKLQGFEKWVLPAVSSVVIIFGGYWAIERTIQLF